MRLDARAKDRRIEQMVVDIERMQSNDREAREIMGNREDSDKFDSHEISLLSSQLSTL
jgi:hypothetical protein